MLGNSALVLSSFQSYWLLTKDYHRSIPIFPSNFIFFPSVQRVWAFTKSKGFLVCWCIFSYLIFVFFWDKSDKNIFVPAVDETRKNAKWIRTQAKKQLERAFRCSEYFTPKGLCSELLCGFTSKNVVKLSLPMSTLNWKLPLLMKFWAKKSRRI